MREGRKFESFVSVGVRGPLFNGSSVRERNRQASFSRSSALRLLPLRPRPQAHQRSATPTARRATLNVEGRPYTPNLILRSCISLGTLGSLTPKIYNSGNRIVQGPGWVAFTNEMIHETRIIPTDGRSNVSAKITSWMGNSVGHWEGDTLVVVTRHVRPEINFQGAPLSEEGRLIERFTRVAAGTLEYRLTVEDPKNWTRSWTMMMPLPRDDRYGFYEYACHEGNYTMFNILSGARAQEKATEER